jgi:hypothetical protein
MIYLESDLLVQTADKSASPSQWKFGQNKYTRCLEGRDKRYIGRGREKERERVRERERARNVVKTLL